MLDVSIFEAGLNLPDAYKKKSVSRRANNQAKIWLKYYKADAPPSPLEHGWVSKDILVIPIMYNNPAFPKNIEDLIQSAKDAESDIDSDADDIDFIDSEEENCTYVFMKTLHCCRFTTKYILRYRK